MNSCAQTTGLFNVCYIFTFLVTNFLSVFRVLSNRMNMTNCMVSLLLIERKTKELALSEERPSLVVA